MSKRWKTILGIMGGIIALCCICIGATAVADSLGLISTSTPTALDISTVVAQTAAMASTQTALVIPTITVTPSPIPTNTIIPISTLTAIPSETPVPTATIVIILPTLPPQQSSCHPSYPDVCIPYPPPDLDCPQISYRNFRITGPDVHRLDGSDNDNMGCEE